MSDNPRAVIGGNNPPLSPLEAMAAHVNDLFEMATSALHGGAITTQAQADQLGELIDEARKAEKEGAAARKSETAPLDEAKKAIMDAWRPLVDEKTGKCRLIIKTANEALAPFLKTQQDNLDAEAAEKRRIADETAAAAQTALRAIDATDLAAREEAETLLKDAGRADRDANRADKQRAAAAGGGRAVGLRSIWAPELKDSTAAIKHYRETQPAALKAWLQQQAEQDVRAGQRAIPGFEISETKVAR